MPVHSTTALPGWVIALPLAPIPEKDVLWICNPHNPTGQLWVASRRALLARYHMVICDEAFLSLVRTVRSSR